MGKKDQPYQDSMGREECWGENGVGQGVSVSEAKCAVYMGGQRKREGLNGLVEPSWSEGVSWEGVSWEQFRLGEKHKDLRWVNFKNSKEARVTAQE